MKRPYRIAALAALMAVVGCNRTEQPGTKSQPNTTANDSAVVPQPIFPAPSQNAPSPASPAAPSASQVAGTEGKADFIATLDNKLKDLDANINELAQKAATYTDEAKSQADQTLAELREQRDKVNAKFEELKKASAEAWTELKAGVVAALDDLEKACESAKAKFS